MSEAKTQKCSIFEACQNFPFLLFALLLLECPIFSIMLRNDLKLGDLIYLHLRLEVYSNKIVEMTCHNISNFSIKMKQIHLTISEQFKNKQTDRQTEDLPLL